MVDCLLKLGFRNYNIFDQFWHWYLTNPSKQTVGFVYSFIEYQAVRNMGFLTSKDGEFIQGNFFKQVL